MKNNIVNVRFTDFDYTLLKGHCEKLDLSVSDYIRSLVVVDIQNSPYATELLKDYYASKDGFDRIDKALENLRSLRG